MTTSEELIDIQKQQFLKYTKLNGQSKQMLKDQQYTYNHGFLFSLTLATGSLIIGLNIYALNK
jgi:hypothetical protein